MFVVFESENYIVLSGIWFVKTVYLNLPCSAIVSTERGTQLQW